MNWQGGVVIGVVLAALVKVVRFIMKHQKDCEPYDRPIYRKWKKWR